MLVERKISAKINYDVLRDLDKTNTQGETSSATGAVVEDDGSERHSVAVISESCVPGEGAESLGPSGWGSLSPRASGRMDRLPSLQTRKRSLPSFARPTTSLPSK